METELRTQALKLAQEAEARAGTIPSVENVRSRAESYFEFLSGVIRQENAPKHS